MKEKEEMQFVSFWILCQILLQIQKIMDALYHVRDSHSVSQWIPCITIQFYLRYHKTLQKKMSTYWVFISKPSWLKNKWKHLSMIWEDSWQPLVEIWDYALVCPVFLFCSHLPNGQNALSIGFMDKHTRT